MGKILRSFVLFAAIAGLMTATGLATAPAQVKDKDKKVDPKDAKKDVKKAEEPGVTEVYMAKDGWRFRIKNAEGKSVAIGTIGFATKEDALRAIEMVKSTLNKGKLVDLKVEKK